MSDSITTRSAANFASDLKKMPSKESLVRTGVPAVFGGMMLTVLLLQPSWAAASEKWETVFSMDANGSAVIAGGVIRNLPIQGRAVLALYALEAGAGCTLEDKNGLQCALTTALGVAPQCSPEHLQLVWTWFGKGPIPKMSGYADKWYKDIETPGKLKTTCYTAPYTSSRQRVWDNIKMKLVGHTLFVDARGDWLSVSESGRFHYKTTYTFDERSVSVASHAEVPANSK